MAKIINGSTIYLALADYLATNAYINDTAKDVLVMVAKWIDEAPTVDAVSRGVLDQVKWERDVAIEQLESYGVSLGEKAEVAKVVRGRWVPLYNVDWISDRKWLTDYVCSGCGQLHKEKSNYCPNCGAKMDGGKDND